MCDAVGHPVVDLQRVAFGPLRLADLPEGASRKLSPAEVEDLRKHANRHQ
jgi:16S rRNA U516 pseudouridylate synthase RsuA-like enzyme